ncbi:MAG: DUF4097 family beta strand repeat-containing protein [Acidobacteriota bacterium]
MRNGSIVAPLLLIGIGGLFLARNVFPELPLLDYLALYWPYLLILWGALRLLEVFLWRSSATNSAGRPLPRAGVSGGEWVLVFFLCLIGMSLHAVRGFSTWLPRAGVEWGGLEVFGESYEFPIAGQATTSANPRVVIENFRGTARISVSKDAGDLSNMVKVSGQNHIRSIDQASATRANQQGTLEVSGNANQVIINVHQDRVSGIRRLDADMDIVVPKGASVVARGHDGDFDISGITGSVDINGRNSSVRLESIGGDVHLNVQGGNLIRAVDLHKSFDLTGNGNDLDLERVAGQVTISGYYSGVQQWKALSGPIHWRGTQTDFSAQGLPGDARVTSSDILMTGIEGPVHMNSQSRDMELNDFTESIDLTINRGDVKLAPGRASLARMTVNVNAGNVDLAMPEGARFDLNAITNRGTAMNDFGSPFMQETNRQGASIRGSIGGPAVNIRVQRGKIQLRRVIGQPEKPGTLTSAPKLPAPGAKAPQAALPRIVEQ